MTIRHVHTFLDHLILCAGACIMTAPMIILFLSSTHSNLTLATDGLQLTLGPEFASVYSRLLLDENLFSNQIGLQDMLFNSIIIASGFASLVTIMSFISAYALVFFKQKFAPMIFMVILMSMFFPIETRILPTFLVVDQLGLNNSYLGLVLPLTATAIGTFILRQYFRQIPDELMDAARIDGAGAYKFLIDIIVPLSARVLFALFMFLFVIGWNQYLWPFVSTLSDDQYFTLVRGIERIGRAGNAGMALAILTVLPPVIFVLLLQSLIFDGLKHTGER